MDDSHEYGVEEQARDLERLKNAEIGANAVPAVVAEWRYPVTKGFAEIAVLLSRAPETNDSLWEALAPGA